MKVITQNLEGFSSYEIVNISDIHIGAKNCAIGRVKETVKFVMDKPNRFVLLNGDLLDLIVHSDRKRFNPSEVDDENFSIRDLGDLSRKQAQLLAKILAPLKSRIVGVVIGNHEVSIAKYHHFNVYDYYCDLLDVPQKARLGDVSIIKFRFCFGGNNIVSRDWVMKHGIGGGGFREGYIANHVMDLFRKYDCDIHTMGHVHKSWAKSFDYVGVNNRGNLIKRRKFYGASGCFLEALNDGSSTYGDQMKGMLPDIGFLVYKIERNGKHEIVESMQEIIY